MRLLPVLLLLACSSTEPQRPAPPVEAPPAAPPEGLLVTIELGSGALQELSESVEAPMVRALLPASPRELVERVVDHAPTVDDRAPVRVAFVGEWQDPRATIAFGTNGGREVVASDPRLLRDARAWMRRPVEVETIEVRFEDAAMGGLRRALDRALDDQVRMARAGIQLEAARHSEPPVYGDPRAFVDWVAQRLASYIAFVPDLRNVELHVELDPLRARGAFEARDESPAAEAIAAEHVEDVPRVPGGTALAWWRASPRSGWAQLLDVTAGDRMSDADRERLAGLADAPTGGLMLAIGRDEVPFVWMRSPHAAPDLAPLLEVAHVRTLLSQFRCERARRVAFGRRLCAEGPWLHMRTENDAHVLSVADRADFRASPPSADARRVLPERASGIILLDAARIAPASGLWRDVAPEAPTRETPMALSWSADGSRVAFEIRFGSGSLAALTDAGLAASDP